MSLNSFCEMERGKSLAIIHQREIASGALKAKFYNEKLQNDRERFALFSDR